MSDPLVTVAGVPRERFTLTRLRGATDALTSVPGQLADGVYPARDVAAETWANRPVSVTAVERSLEAA